MVVMGYSPHSIKDSHFGSLSELSVSHPLEKVDERERNRTSNLLIVS
jgi:hypothetical protein